MTLNSATPFCDCVSPFFGRDCYRESYSDSYIAIGSPSSGDVTLEVISTADVDRFSFPFDNGTGTTCTGLCDMDQSCIGVIYNQAQEPDFGMDGGAKPMCSLLSGYVTVNPSRNIPYTTQEDSSLYVKSTNSLKFTDRVFLYSGELPLRYWVSDRYNDSKGNRVFVSYVGVQYHLDFVPINVVSSNLTGVFSNKEIPMDNIVDIVNGGTNSDYLVVPPGQTVLNIPSSWTRPRTVWVEHDTPVIQLQGLYQGLEIGT